MNYITQYTCMTISSYCLLHCFLPVATNCESELWYTRLTRFVSGWVVSNQWQVFLAGDKNPGDACFKCHPLTTSSSWSAGSCAIIRLFMIASLPIHSQLYWATRFMSQCFFQMRFWRCSSHSVWNDLCAVSYFFVFLRCCEWLWFCPWRSTFDSIHYMV